jgi:hypothetical protein
MSIEAVDTEIERFLRSPEPEGLCIRGKWGVGKTFNWKKCIAEAQKSKKIALERYSYVSLFGLSSLDEFKYAIFENTVPVEKVAEGATPETYNQLRLDSVIRGRKWFRYVKGIPAVSNYFAGLEPASFLTVRNQIVCIDDLDRKSNDLDVEEILGLLAFLKEERRCKTVLILNSEQLGEEEKKSFDSLLDKVVDVSLVFEPTPLECVGIAFSEDDVSIRLLRENCVALGISNIRVMKKLERFVRLIQPMLEIYDESVFAQAVHTIALIGWSVCEPAVAPSLEFLKKRGGSYFDLKENEEISPKEAAWNALLSEYNFAGLDEFDIAIQNGICSGYCNAAAVTTAARKLELQINANKSAQKYRGAWDLYNDSFDNNEEEVVENIYNSLIENVDFIGIQELAAAVGLLKDFDRTEQAKELINYYVSNRNGDREVFDLEGGFWGDEVNDPDIRAAFTEKLKTFQDDRNAIDVMEKVAKKDGWSREDLEYLASIPVSTYQDIFKGHTGAKLRSLVRACLQFDNIGNADQFMREISERAKQALEEIGKESRINARRVRPYVGRSKDSSGPAVDE